MRIFHVSGDPGIAPDGSKGASVHLRCIARALIEEGHDVTTFSARKTTTDMPFPAPLLGLESAEDLTEEARRSGAPDCIYERYALGQRTGLGVARDLACPLVLEVNSPLCDETARFRPHRLGEHDVEIETELFRKADLVVAVSEPLRRFVASKRGTEDGTMVIPNGCSPTLYSDRPQPPADEKPVLVFLGNPKPWHGADSLPELVEGLVTRGHDLTCLVIGGGSGAARICDIAETRGVRDRFLVTGEVTQQQAAAHLMEATLLVAPYPEHEFFYFCPLKVIEAMAAGLPVVSTDQGDIASLLGGTGVLVPAGEPEAFLLAVSALLADGERRRELGRRARARAEGKLTWRHHARLLVETVTARHLGATR